MSDMFSFEPTALELLLSTVKRGTKVSAIRFLTAAEREDDQAIEDAFEQMAEMGIQLDISDLPEDLGAGETESRLRLEQRLVEEKSLLQELEEGDPLRLYLEELSGIPAQGDVRLLSAELLEGREGTAEKLLRLNMYRAVDAAMSCTARGVLLLDLIQEASLGLWQGIVSFSGGDLEPHLDWWITHCLSKAIILQARESGLLRSMSDAMDAYRRADKALLDRLGRSATLEEIAVEMGVTRERAELAGDMLQSAREMDALKGETPAADEDEQQAVEDTAYYQSRQRVTELLSELTEQETKVLTLRYGLGGSAAESVEAVGAKLGILPEAVIAIEAAALEKMRKKSL